MTTIKDRLRDSELRYDCIVCGEAADEIERLEHEIAKARSDALEESGDYRNGYETGAGISGKSLSDAVVLAAMDFETASDNETRYLAHRKEYNEREHMALIQARINAGDSLFKAIHALKEKKP